VIVCPKKRRPKRSVAKSLRKREKDAKIVLMAVLIRTKEN